MGFLKEQTLALRSARARDPDAAIKILTEALTNTKEDTFYLEMIAHCQWVAGRDEMAIAAAKQVLTHSPNYFGALEVLARLHAERSEYEMAAHYARLGLENFPERLYVPQTLVRLFGWLLRLPSLFSRRFQTMANEGFPDPNKGRDEWYAWAKQYLKLYEATHGGPQNPRIH